MVRLRHRIVPSPAPGMTAREPFQAQPSATERAMSLHCFEKIRRTGWMKPAAVTRPSQPREHRRERPLVDTNEETNEQDHRQGHRIGVRRPGCNRPCRSLPPALAPNPALARACRPYSFASMNRREPPRVAPAAAILFQAWSRSLPPPAVAQSPPAKRPRRFHVVVAARFRATVGAPGCAPPRHQAAAKSRSRP